MAKQTTVKSNAPWHARQGDVMVMALDGGRYDKRLKIPEDAKDTTPTKEGRIVLAYGEVTGHAHALALKPKSTMKRLQAGPNEVLTYLQNVGAPIVHEEHDAIPLVDLAPTIGTDFIAVRQTEYVPKERPRQVAD